MGKAERLVEEMRPRAEVSLPRQCRRHLGKRREAAARQRWQRRQRRSGGAPDRAPDVAPDMGAGRRTRAMAAVGLSSREGCRGGDEAAFGLKARSIQTTTKVKRKAYGTSDFVSQSALHGLSTADLGADPLDAVCARARITSARTGRPHSCLGARSGSGAGGRAARLQVESVNLYTVRPATWLQRKRRVGRPVLPFFVEAVVQDADFMCRSPFEHPNPLSPRQNKLCRRDCTSSRKVHRRLFWWHEGLLRLHRDRR